MMDTGYGKAGKKALKFESLKGSRQKVQEESTRLKTERLKGQNKSSKER